MMKNQEGKKADKIKAKAKKIQQKQVSIENVAVNIESLTAIQHAKETIKESVSTTTVGSSDMETYVRRELCRR